MLLVDNEQITIADLLAIEPRILEVALDEEVNLEESITDAWEQVTDRISSRSAGELDLATIIASDPVRKLSTLQRTILYAALALAFRAAVARVDNDRYASKLDYYLSALDQTWAAVWGQGLRLAAPALPCPGAQYVYGVGRWGRDNLTDVAGPTADAKRVRIAITWSSAVAESGPSRFVEYSVPADRALRVSIAGLSPPAGATHWRIYACEGPFDDAPALNPGCLIGAAIADSYLLQTTVPIASTAYELQQLVTGGAALRVAQPVDPANVYRLGNMVHRA